MLRMNGVEAWISSEDKTPFAAYGVEKDATTGVMSCWIAYEPGMVRSRCCPREIAHLTVPRRTLRYAGETSTAQWT